MTKPKYPIADRIPHKIIMFNDTRIDYYDWLRDNNWPDVKDEKILNYLKDENNYAENEFFNKNKDL